MKQYKFWLGLILLFLIVALSMLSPLATHDFFPVGRDYGIHCLNISEAMHAYLSGQFWLRAAPDLVNGWIYPVFQFYAPFAYTVAGIVALIDPHNAFQGGFKYTFVLAAILGGIYCYRLYFMLFKNEIAAILGAVLYLLSPYLLINLDVRGDFSETFTQCIFPVVLYYWFCLYQAPRWDRAKIGFFFKATIAYYCLMTAHLITFLSTTFFMLLLFLILSVQKRQLKQMLPLLLCMGVTVCLAAWYLAPILYIHSMLNISDSIVSPWVEDFFTNLPTVLAPKALNIGPGFGGLAVDPSLGIPVMVSAGYWIYQFYFKRNPDMVAQSSLIKAILWVFLLAFLVAWTPFNFWRFLPAITYVVQFSYRILTDCMWLGGVLFVAMLVQVCQNKLSARHCLLGLLLIPLANSQWMSSNYMQGLGSGIPIKQLNDHATIATFYNFDYLMRPDAPGLTQLARINASIIPVSDIQTSCVKKNSNAIHCLLNTRLSKQYTQLPIAYFPDLLKITVNGQEVPYYPSVSTLLYQDNPAIRRVSPVLLAAVQLSSGPQRISAEFRGFGWANCLSQGMAVLLILAGLFCWFHPRLRR